MEAAPKPKRVVGRPFQKGQSGNPSGRPRGQSITALLRAELEKAATKGSPVLNNQMIAAMLVKLATGGDLGAIREVIDRTEGKAIARTETGEPGDFDLDLETARKVLKIVPRDA